jgi:hypothetical protein
LADLDDLDVANPHRLKVEEIHDQVPIQIHDQKRVAFSRGHVHPNLLQIPSSTIY